MRLHCLTSTDYPVFVLRKTQDTVTDSILMARRRQAREVALQLLYQRDINPDTSLQVARESLDELLPAQVLRDFSWQIYVGTTSRLAEIDEQIIEAADNWSLSRMAPTDRNVIRMGIYEMTAMETLKAWVSGV